MTRWDRLRHSFLFLPGVLCVVAIALAEALIFLDRRIGDVDLGPLGAVLTQVGASGSRDLLAAIAGSMLTVASTTFSITVAVLALSSSTYGPRLVRNFMSDRGNQLVLGIFVATFLYSLMVLRSVRVVADGDEQYFVPHLAVNMAVLLAVSAIGVLVYFIHHISDSVQVATLARRVRDDLLRAVDRLYPEQVAWSAGDVAAERDAPASPVRQAEATTVLARESGYVQALDHDDLLAVAREHDLVIWLQVRPGDHALAGLALAEVGPPERVGERVRARLRSAIVLGRARTPEQDVEFAALVLEEMAVRALSPGTNDPYTAINALDALSVGLVRLAGRPTPSPYRFDHEGRLRVVAPAVTLTDVVDHVLDAMRCYALEHPTVLHRTLQLVGQVGAASHDAAVRQHLVRQVELICEAVSGGSLQRYDGDGLRRHAEQVSASLGIAVARADHPQQR